MPAAPRRQRRLILDALLLGVVGALAAVLFSSLLSIATRLFLSGIADYRPPGLPSEGGRLLEVMGPHGLWLLPLATTVGGLLVGLLVQSLAPEAEGHGTDTVVRALHRAGGALRRRVAPVKLVASAITIGSGGAAGREGPIALIAAALGSWYADLTNRSERERRLLVLIGMAAGLAAIFRSPIGTALFAIEVLYSGVEFEAGVLLYALLASIVAYAVNGVFAGWHPLFRAGDVALPSTVSNGWFIVLGVVAGLLAAVIPTVFFWLRDSFRRLPVRAYWKPALGGLATGLLAIAYPQVIGGGYGWIQEAIDGRIALGTLLVLPLAKLLAMSFTVSSGGSGGVFAPSLYIGAMLGAGIAAVAGLPAAPFAIVGMAAVFGAAARVPVATLMMVTEMTGGYTLLVPTALAVTLSYLIQSRLTGRRKYRSLYEAQVETPADSPAHHAAHLNIALRILEQRRTINPADVERLNLLNLLRSGIPVVLPDGRRLAIRVLRAESPFAKQPMDGDAERFAGADASVLAIIRGEHMLAPRPDTVLEPGDRLILLATAQGLEALAKHVEPW